MSDMADWIKWGNDKFTEAYKNLQDGVKAAEQSWDLGKQWLTEIAGSAKKASEWAWITIQGDFVEDRTIGQIAADAVLMLVPILGTILSIRDLVANAKKIYQKPSDTWLWVGLVLCLISFIPELGAVFKGVFKIIFSYLRKFGLSIVAKFLDKALAPAIEAIAIFLKDKQVIKVIGRYDIGKFLKEASSELRNLTSKINKQTLLGYFDIAIQKLDNIIHSATLLLPQDKLADLLMQVERLKVVRHWAENQLEPALKPVKDLLNEVSQWLEKKAAQLEGHAAQTEVKNLHLIYVSKVDLKVLGTAKKGIYGEIVSDNYMISHGYESKLLPNRRIRSMEDVPKGRGIDGVYSNPKPPPDHIITETKYRTKSGDYIDSEGNASKSLLGQTKDGPQLSDKWIANRLEKEAGRDGKKEVENSKYERWLMIVDDSGSVVNITKVDGMGKIIGNIKP